MAISETSFRPISETQFNAAKEQKLHGLITTCINCRQPFSSQNVYSLLGWKETQISGYCECCFDGLFNIKDE